MVLKIKFLGRIYGLESAKSGLFGEDDFERHFHAFREIDLFTGDKYAANELSRDKRALLRMTMGH